MAANPTKADPAQPANGNGASASNPELLRRLYASLLRYRKLSERAQGSAAAAPAGEFAIGHEAIVAGAMLELGPADTLVAPPRNFALQIAKEARLPAGHPDSLGPFNLGTGMALAHQLENTRHVVIAFSAEGTASLDRWHAAMKFAGAHKLPVIYVLRCGSAFETGATTRTPALEEISFMARDCGFPAVIVDGMDAVAVWRVTQESIHRARNGSGPTLIECETRSTEYKDPLAHMEHYMRKRGGWNEQWRRELMDAIEAEIRVGSVQD
jgi:TPP-dependent pyruvate/acetoin dehydrogenase alpha subunit